MFAQEMSRWLLKVQWGQHHGDQAEAEHRVPQTHLGFTSHILTAQTESIRIWVTSERNFARPPGCILWRYKACSMFLLLVKSFYNPMEDWLAGVDEMGWEYLIFPQVLGEYKSNEVKKLMMGLTRWDTFNLPGLSFGNNIEHKRELHWI